MDKDSEGIETEEESSSINLDDIIQKIKDWEWENQRKRKVERDKDTIYPNERDLNELSVVEGRLYNTLNLKQIKDLLIGLSINPTKSNPPSPTCSQTPSCSFNPPPNPYPQSPSCSTIPPPETPFKTYGRTQSQPTSKARQEESDTALLADLSLEDESRPTSPIMVGQEWVDSDCDS